MATISNRISALFDAQINNVLFKGADAIAKDARANAPTKRIAANIFISPIENTANGKQIQVYVDIRDDHAPEGAAYEFGSGIHGETGDTYPINKRIAPNLVFFWTKMDKWFVGPHVDHPGVAARPYLAPAVAKNRATVLGLLSRAVSLVTRTAITTGFRKE